MEYESGALETSADIEKNPAGVVKRWVLEIGLADKREKDWYKSAEKVWDRYRQKDSKKHSYNILWANTETLRPAVYNSLPSPDVRRRFKDADPLGRAVSEVLSRAVEYGLDTTSFDADTKSCVLDMLLPGRAVARVRYVPSLVMEGEDPSSYIERLQWEQAPIEHVQWDDFRILCAAKEWCEVTAIGFRHRMKRDDLVEKFGEVGELVQLDNTDNEEVEQEQDHQVKDAFKTAEVWEIWDKEKATVFFICKGYKEKPLMEVKDPLNLTGFFPIPKPLYAIEDSSSLVPVALYELYKEQAEELDRISGRINVIVKGLKLRGIYDATLTELSEVMRGEDNDLIPSSGVTALIERGGLEKAIWMMPIETAAMVLRELYVQRDQTKAVIYEITGISDILRGSTDAGETATAQQIKSQWGSNRLKRMQGEVARFIRDLIRIQAEIIGEKFTVETLQTMTALQFPSMQEKQQMMMAQQQGQEVPPEMLNKPTWEEVIQVLRDDKQRTFKVDIETDSTIAASIESDMQGLTEVLGGITQLITGLGPAVQMGALPLEALKEIILTVVRRAKMGNAVEDAFDKMQQPPPPPQEQQQPDNSLEVEQLRQQGEQQKTQAESQAKQAEIQVKAQLEQMKLQAEQQRESERLQFEQWKAELENSTKVVIAELQAKTSLKQSSMTVNAAKDQETLTELDEEGEEKPTSALASLVDAINNNFMQMIESQNMAHQNNLMAQQQSHAQMIQALTRPKTATLSNGRKVVVE